MLPAAGFIPGVRPQSYSVNVGIKIKFLFKTKEGLENIQVDRLLDLERMEANLRSHFKREKEYILTLNR